MRCGYITIVCTGPSKRGPCKFRIALMDSPVSRQNIDSILLPLLQTHEASYNAALDQVLAAYAEPVIAEILRYRLLGSANPSTPQSDLEDVHSEVVLRLLTRLQDFLLNPEERAIVDFCKYTAVVAHNACNDYFREKYPERSRLKNRLRYLFRHHPSFAIWESVDHEWLCGFTQWQDRKSPGRSEKFHRLLNHPASWQREERAKGDLASLVNKIFLHLQNPLLLDDLVNIAAVLLGIQENVKQNEPLEGLPGPSNQKELSEDHGLYLTQLWKEIQKLPVRQRKALLLNLRGPTGTNVMPLFPRTGIAGMRQIAVVLEMSHLELARLWPDLPMEDSNIAIFLNLTRQQVINLRKSARERLARRMKVFEQKAKIS
jgi:DNA-directed RNA polymerase specialized sigma24 family protein